MKKFIVFTCIVSLLAGGVQVNGACPKADITGDCKVNLEDFAIMSAGWLTTYSYTDLTNMASEWLSEGVPEPAGVVFVTIIDDGVPGYEGFNGEMSKYETTNAQYCQFLNAALASGDIYVSNNHVYGASGSNAGEDFVGQVYFDTSNYTSSSQITWNGTSFSVRSRDGYDMSNHPVVMVSWYGATAFCNYYGYRLPTEWEWQAVADYDGTFTYGCGTKIDHGKANYDKGNPLNLTSFPYTTPVDHYPSYGYGMNDMAGNVSEWIYLIYNDNYCVVRGGSWDSFVSRCTVSIRLGSYPYSRDDGIGFRVCR